MREIIKNIKETDKERIERITKEETLTTKEIVIDIDYRLTMIELGL